MMNAMPRSKLNVSGEAMNTVYDRSPAAVHHFDEMQNCSTGIHLNGPHFVFMLLGIERAKEGRYRFHTPASWPSVRRKNLNKAFSANQRSVMTRASAPHLSFKHIHDLIVTARKLFVSSSSAASCCVSPSSSKSSGSGGKSSGS